MPKTNKKKGFTLLEILLVIAAIGILVAIVLVAINPNRQLAQVRNAERRSEINTIYKAIEQYLIDKGSYPTGITTSIQDICNTGSQKSTDTLSPTTLCDNKADLRVLVPDYIAAIPIDPQGVAYKVAINGANNRVSVYASNVELGQIIGVNNAWAPAQLPGLSLWLDAADASTITLNSSTVSQWSDKSGNARHATQATAASQPAYTAAGLNGKAVLTFDGSNDLFELSSGILLNDNFTYVYSVYGRPTSAQHSIDVGPTTGNVGYGNWWFMDNNLYSSLRSTEQTHGSSVATGTFINGLVRNNSGTQAYRNGAAFGTPQGAAATGQSTLNGIGRGSVLGTNFHNGPMAEVIVGRVDLSTLDRQKLEGYLAWKWGLVHNLPANHPYRWDGREFGYTFSGITDTDAQTYIAGVERADGQVLESGTRTAIQNFIVGAKADGIWDAIKSSAILAGARTLNGALVPLKGTAPTNFNFVSGDYNRKTGLVGNGSTKYLDSNRNNNADPQNSKHLAVFTTTFHTRDATRAVIGSNAAVGDSQLFTAETPAKIFFRNNFSDAGVALLSSATTTGLWGSSRSSSAGYTGRFGGSSASYTDTSTTPTSGSIAVFVRGTSNYSNARLAFYSIGESLDLALLDARVTTLINAIGGAIP